MFCNHVRKAAHPDRWFARFVIVTATVGAAFFALRQDTEATSTSFACEPGFVTCFGATYWFHDADFGYATYAVSQAYDSFGNVPLTILKADIRGTNWAHSGDALVSTSCDGSSTGYCVTQVIYPCGTSGGGNPCINLSSGDPERWYATTRHRFVSYGFPFNYNVYTATSSIRSRVSYTCWISMSCGSGSYGW